MIETALCYLTKKQTTTIVLGAGTASLKGLSFFKLGIEGEKSCEMTESRNCNLRFDKTILGLVLTKLA